jgi:hypothetical protein
MKKLLTRLAGEFLNTLIDRKIIDFIAGQLVREVVNAMPVKVFEVASIQIAKLELKPGDKIILKYPGRLSDVAFERLRVSMKPYFPDHEIIILEENMDIQIARDGGKKADCDAA